MNKQLKGKPRGRPWPPGVSGNPRGRPVGALNKLSLAVRGGALLAVNEPVILEQSPAPEPIYYDAGRGHRHNMHIINGRVRRTVEQDGLIFDRDTGLLIS